MKYGAATKSLLKAAYSAVRAAHDAHQSQSLLELRQQLSRLDEEVVRRQDSTTIWREGVAIEPERYGHISGATVILNGCETGRGFSGGDILGLTSAFLYAGVVGIIAGLWRIDDNRDSHEWLLSLPRQRL